MNKSSRAAVQASPVSTRGGACSPTMEGRHYDKMSVDSHLTDADEEASFLEACIDCDDDSLYEIIQNGVTWEQVNERDKSGRVSAIFLFSTVFENVGGVSLPIIREHIQHTHLTRWNF